jgi:hypothetical protein
MSQMLTLLPLLACAVMMFGGGAVLWFTTRTPLRRVPWIARRARRRGHRHAHHRRVARMTAATPRRGAPRAP